MDVDGIKKLITLMNDNDLCELEVEEEGRKVRLRKHEQHPPSTGMVMQMPMGMSPAGLPAAPSAASPAAKPARTDLFELKSPLVGTFYRSAKPGSPPYADVNDRVGPDKTVCIIEAMKVMNEIKAEIEGVIEAVLVNNGEPVEFNQPIFLIRKEG
ncbi:MAG: acetyl-CoA carboxylase biotin carboxyl carrier protein [Planctomycetes bacterium]|nr:acetyl-CoA carboxylase biotin carboxyl carrier protein [Planctomycetota bacterium]